MDTVACMTDLPAVSAAIMHAYVAVQDSCVSGGTSPVKDAQYQVFVYDTDNDR